MKVWNARPHPDLLPRGEGTAIPPQIMRGFLARTQRPVSLRDGNQFSLSHWERAGVRGGQGSENGSVLIIVLWIAFGLVAMALYFANSMSSELRASDNRVEMLAADQAIEGAARYVTKILAEQGTNGLVPYINDYA